MQVKFFKGIGTTTQYVSYAGSSIQNTNIVTFMAATEGAEHKVMFTNATTSCFSYNLSVYFNKANGTKYGQLLMLKNLTGAVVYLEGSISSYLITLATAFAQWIIWNGSSWE